jgi:hypothetical protein
MADGGLHVWLSKAGQLLGVTGVEVLENSSEGAAMTETTGTAVQVTQEQLRTALRTLLGSSAQVTARMELNRVLPKQHKAIAWHEWQAAAEAERLQIAAEIWGITIWRKGETKTAVPPFTQESAKKSPPQSTAPTPDDAQAIATAARSYMEAQARKGCAVSTTDAVREVLKQRRVRN